MPSSCVLISGKVLPSRLPTRLDDLVNMLSAILMRRLQVVQLLVKICNIRFQLRRLGREPLLHLVHWTEHKPAAYASDELPFNPV